MTNHYIKCRHCIGNKCYEYLMKCNILSKTKSDKLKIEVFGDRYWKDKEHIKKIRYVDSYRVIESE